MRYYVTSIKDGDEWTVLKTDRLEDARECAREEASHKGYIVEIRVYAEDIEDDNCTCFDYDTVAF